MTNYGLIGKKLTHSFSKEIHNELADYQYDLIELTEEEVADFFVRKEFQAVNVTIPYKETVLPYLDEISPIAKKIGAVNTVVNKNGKLFGDNTDYWGMKALAEKIGLDFSGKKVLVLGTGGTSKTARVLAEDLGAAKVYALSRTKKEACITYEEAISVHSDAQIILNTTPVGMYPECDKTPIDISHFPKLEGVLDAVYHPLCTNLVLDAKKRGIKAEGGLYMLVMQAVYAVEKFLDTKISEKKANSVYRRVLSSKENIVLTGMPGSGKTTVGKNISFGDFIFTDTDTEIEKRCGCTIKELIETKGEPYFRDLETQVIREISQKNGLIIATGGGAILREENVRALKRNGKLYFLDVNWKWLKATESRPLSDTDEKLKKLYEERIRIYRETADVIVPNHETPRGAAYHILIKREELCK